MPKIDYLSFTEVRIMVRVKTNSRASLSIRGFLRFTAKQALLDLKNSNEWLLLMNE